MVIISWRNPWALGQRWHESDELFGGEGRALGNVTSSDPHVHVQHLCSFIQTFQRKIRKSLLMSGRPRPLPEEQWEPAPTEDRIHRPENTLINLLVSGTEPTHAWKRAPSWGLISEPCDWEAYPPLRAPSLCGNCVPQPDLGPVRRSPHKPPLVVAPSVTSPTASVWGERQAWRKKVGDEGSERRCRGWCWMYESRGNKKWGNESQKGRRVEPARRRERETCC